MDNREEARADLLKTLEEMKENRRQEALKKNPSIQFVTEDMHPEKEWFEQARNMTVEELPEFIRHLTEDYYNDYGTACHAVAAGAVAAAWALCEKEGLSSFQAGFVMWDFIRNWTCQSNKCGLKLLDYDDMLYPQYDDKYEKTISSHVWRALQNEAAERLKKEMNACESVKAHWASIVAGQVPFGYKVKEDEF